MGKLVDMSIEFGNFRLYLNPLHLLTYYTTIYLMSMFLITMYCSLLLYLTSQNHIWERFSSLNLLLSYPYESLTLLFDIHYQRLVLVQSLRWNVFENGSITAN